MRCQEGVIRSSCQLQRDAPTGSPCAVPGFRPAPEERLLAQARIPCAVPGLSTAPEIATPCAARQGQRSVLLRRNTTINAGSMFHIEDASGNTLVSFMPDYRYSCVLVSSPELTSGTTYSVYSGGSDSGTEVDGLYEGGSYTPGTLHTSFTSSGMVQQVNF